MSVKIVASRLNDERGWMLSQKGTWRRTRTRWFYEREDAETMKRHLAAGVPWDEALRQVWNPLSVQPIGNSPSTG